MKIPPYDLTHVGIIIRRDLSHVGIQPTWLQSRSENQRATWINLHWWLNVT